MYKLSLSQDWRRRLVHTIETLWPATHCLNTARYTLWAGILLSLLWGLTMALIGASELFDAYTMTAIVARTLVAVLPVAMALILWGETGMYRHYLAKREMPRAEHLLLGIAGLLIVVNSLLALVYVSLN